jgi:hypothetical protein
VNARDLRNRSGLRVTNSFVVLSWLYQHGGRSGARRKHVVIAQLVATQCLKKHESEKYDPKSPFEQVLYCVVALSLLSPAAETFKWILK